MPLLHLPEDTLELVTSFLNNNMLNNFGKTCKVFHELLQECTTRRSICKQPLGHCIECNKHSFNMSLIHCTILTEESNTIICLQLCSKECRMSYLNHLPDCFCASFYVSRHVSILI